MTLVYSFILCSDPTTHLCHDILNALNKVPVRITCVIVNTIFHQGSYYNIKVILKQLQFFSFHILKFKVSWQNLTIFFNTSLHHDVTYFMIVFWDKFIKEYLHRVVSYFLHFIKLKIETKIGIKSTLFSNG